MQMNHNSVWKAWKSTDAWKFKIGGRKNLKMKLNKIINKAYAEE